MLIISQRCARDIQNLLSHQLIIHVQQIHPLLEPWHLCAILLLHDLHIRLRYAVQHARSQHDERFGKILKLGRGRCYC